MVVCRTGVTPFAVDGRIPSYPTILLKCLYATIPSLKPYGGTTHDLFHQQQRMGRHLQQCSYQILHYNTMVARQDEGFGSALNTAFNFSLSGLTTIRLSELQ